ncbi:MAG TPA: hypothetical protein PKD05_01630, partial [Candidatus Melainabacteria bacterium]|nr:hypothetical protein [Candidatus Melainabacteria bacterium]
MTASNPRKHNSFSLARDLKRRSTAVLIVSLLLSGLFAPLLPADAQANQSTTPRLVVMLVADQFPFSYLERYKSRLS